jgi:hypothetical protein
MTIPLLPLDDRRFDDLVKEFQALAPRYAEEWTNRNAADPGIMLLELFAWLTESQLYRINRVPKAVTQSFLQWLLADGAQKDTLATAREKVYHAYSHPKRLITKTDYESIIMDQFKEAAARVYCAPERDFTRQDPTRPRTGHLSVMVVARPVTQSAPVIAPAFSADNNDLIVTTANRRYRFSIDKGLATVLATGREMAMATSASQPPAATPTDRCFSADRKRAVSVETVLGSTEQGAKGEIRLRVWRVETGEELALFTIPFTGSAVPMVETLFFATDNQYLITTIVSKDGQQLTRQPAIWPIHFDAIATFVADNRQVGCQTHVVGARYKVLTIKAEVALKLGAPENKRQDKIKTDLQNFFDPRTGGPDGAGWPFGRKVTHSEVYHLIHSVQDVEYVTSLLLNDGEQDVEVGEHELVDLYEPEISIYQRPMTQSGGTATSQKWGQR